MYLPSIWLYGFAFFRALNVFITSKTSLLSEFSYFEVLLILSFTRGCSSFGGAIIEPGLFYLFIEFPSFLSAVFLFVVLLNCSDVFVILLLLFLLGLTVEPGKADR